MKTPRKKILTTRRRQKENGIVELIRELKREVEIGKLISEEEREITRVIDRAKAIAERENHPLTADEYEEIRKLVQERQTQNRPVWTYVRGLTPHTDLYVNSETGCIFHGTMRHVLFRVGTIQDILFMLASKKLPSDPNQRLRQTGFRMGTGFGEDFKKHLEEQGLISNPDLNKMIRQWCDFDVSGGWGKWISTPMNDKYEGMIQVEHNFLTYQTNSELWTCAYANKKNSGLCKLLIGYIEGVLQVLTSTARANRDWTVVVKELECGIDSPTVKPCKFQFTLLNPGTTKAKKRDTVLL